MHHIPKRIAGLSPAPVREFLTPQDDLIPCTARQQLVSLMIDRSGSMSGTPIGQVNEGVATFVRDLSSDPFTRPTVQLQIVSFGETVECSEFAPICSWSAPTFVAHGATPMAEAILHAVTQTEHYANRLRTGGEVELAKPLHFLFSDGAPTSDRAVLHLAAATIRQLERERRGAFYAFGVSPAAVAALQPMFVRRVHLLGEDNFPAFFRILSTSVRSMSVASISDDDDLTPLIRNLLRARREVATMPEVYLRSERLILRPESAYAPGREGTVYQDPNDEAFVIKLPHVVDDPWRDKLRVMLAHPLTAPDIAWPTDAVLGPDRATIVGCRMPLAAHSSPLVVLFNADPTTRWLTADYAFRLDVATNLVAAVQRVHKHGCVIGDISPANIFVRKKDGAVCLIDTDSFQLTRSGRTFRCNVGTPDYTPAELHGPKFEDIDRTVYQDAFGLAALIFQLLVGPGNHPFAARYLGTATPLSLTDRIRLGIWPYATGGHPEYVPRTGAPLDLLHPQLHPLMFRCFELGHQNDTERPLPVDWLVALSNVRQDTDFVHVEAPRREAEAHSRQRQAILATFAQQPVHNASGFAVRKVRAALRRVGKKKLVAMLASLTLVGAGAGAALYVRSLPLQIHFAAKAEQLRATPQPYGELVREFSEPAHDKPSRTPPVSTPQLYQDLANLHSYP